MLPALLTDRLTACLLILLTLLVAVIEWGGSLPAFAVPLVALIVLVLLSTRVRAARLAFVAVGILLTLLLALSGQDWFSISVKGLGSAAFIAAFFTALSTLRNVAETSPVIRAGGTFLALQPPGRRYAALTAGGHLFALLLNYGAISLLGSLASTSARAEPNPEIRRIRLRRMLLAIQRGFIASLPWSPMSFAMAITTALIPGARWSDGVIPGLVTAAIIMGSGWALDSIFKPRLSAPPPPRGPVEGTWALMLPLFGLLAILAVSVGTLHALSGVRVVGIVMIVVPVISLVWAVIQHRGGAMDFTLGERVKTFLATDLPGYRGEITLLMMAGYIGTVGAPLLEPLVAGTGFHPEELPPWVVLASFILLLPILGQLGMNPILAVTLIAPLIPEPAQMGVTPTAVVTAIAAGWAVSGVCSPFTATTLLVGSFGGVSALHVGLRWNGLYVAVLIILLSVWVLGYAFLFA